jgi:hypothetical protein
MKSFKWMKKDHLVSFNVLSKPGTEIHIVNAVQLSPKTLSKYPHAATVILL